MSFAGLCDGFMPHHLDHLAPLCSLWELPLILTDERMLDLAKRYYPELTTIFFYPHEAPEKLVHQFDGILYTTPRIYFDQIYFLAQQMQNKQITTIWCPHGNSDKGRNSVFMEVLKDEQLILTYGPRMETFLKEKSVMSPQVRMGNVRLAYYQRHQSFYDQFLSKKTKPTILYAPTWQDHENNSSFPNIYHLFLDAPQDFDVLIKLHPNLYQQYPQEIALLKNEGVQLVEEFPPIYPLLSHIDLYLGDHSSISYDCLFFNKPMIFLSQSHLSEYGRYVPSNELSNLFEICIEEYKKTPNYLMQYQDCFGDETLKTHRQFFDKIKRVLV